VTDEALAVTNDVTNVTLDVNVSLSSKTCSTETKFHKNNDIRMDLIRVWDDSIR
jgi:hypothetical protein